MKTLLLEREGPAAIVKLNRPDKLIALNTECLQELENLLPQLAADRSIRVLIITGSGNRAFAAGADIGELRRLDPAGAAVFAEFGQRVFSALEAFPRPVIAAVNGAALGGGAELAWCCHFRIASETARFGQPEINLGLIPGFGGTQRLTRMLPRAKACEMLLTGEPIAAAEAQRWGLVNDVVPADELMNAAKTLAAKLAAKPARVVTYLLQSIRAAAETTQQQGQAIEAELFGR